MSIFPSETIQISTLIQATAETTKADLPLLKEYAWDFNKNEFILVDGKNVIVTGKEAIKVWIWKAFKTERYKFLAYSWDYGQEFDSTINQGLSRESLKSELTRTIIETLAVNPYITQVKDISITFAETIKAQVTVNTVYGEVEMSV